MHPYFKQLAESLAIEKKADQIQFQASFQQKSISEKRATGLLWHPLVIKQVESTWGDYIQVTIERPSHGEIPSAFKSGMSIQLFSLAEPDEQPIEGQWLTGGGNQGVLFFRLEELPSWTRKGKLVLETLFDHHSYQVMEEALIFADQRIPESSIIRTVIGVDPFISREVLPVDGIPNLNESQNLAVAAMASDQPIVAIQGPPGTGKTTTLVEGIRRLKGKTWVCAPSHTAVDVITLRLVSEGVRVVRVGLPERMTPELWEVSLDRLIEVHPTHQQIKKIKKQARELKRLAHQYKRNFGFSERNQRKLLFDEAAAQDRYAQDLEKDIVSDILKEHQVITGTLVGIRQIFPWMSQADHLVIDEAGQSLEPACWVTLSRANRLILAGDPKQLPPTVFERKSGLENTLLAKIMDRDGYHLLDVQYRMHPWIAEFASTQFYEDKLKSGDHWITWKLEKPFVWIDTAGSGFNEKSSGNSWYNPEEADWIIKQMTHEQTKDPTSPMVVIAPYKAQVQYFQSQLSQTSPSILASTIDGYQGQEQDIVWISLTRSNVEGNIGFLIDLRRIHVAMTRAKKQVVFVGDSGTWGKHDFFAQILEHAEKKEGYCSVWDFSD